MTIDAPRASASAMGRAEIGIGTDHAVLNGDDRFALIIEVNQWVTGSDQGIEPGHEIIARDNRDPAIIQSRLIEYSFGLGSAGVRVHATGIGDDLQVGLFFQSRCEALQDIQKIGGISRLRIFVFLERKNGHGEFGEVFERQVIEVTLLGQENACIEVVAPEAAAITDTYLFHMPTRPLASR